MLVDAQQLRRLPEQPNAKMNQLSRARLNPAASTDRRCSGSPLVAVACLPPSPPVRGFVANIVSYTLVNLTSCACTVQHRRVLQLKHHFW